MALLMSMMRASALTQSPEPVHAWFAGRQSAGWAGQWGARSVARKATAEHAAPAAGAPRAARDPVESLRTLGELHARGAVTDEEFEQLKARVGP